LTAADPSHPGAAARHGAAERLHLADRAAAASLRETVAKPVDTVLGDPFLDITRTLRMYYPDAADVEEWVGENGINGFRDGLEQRRGCCAIRKVQPFRRAVTGRGAWVTGIRRGQSASRALASPVEWDGEYGLFKISPLLDWSEDEIWDYIRRKRLPYNVLHDRGFPSIGCAPCTRAVEPGADERSGRWWWERADSRECGLHPRRSIPAAAALSGGLGHCG